jgi:hypothetical protein
MVIKQDITIAADYINNNKDHFRRVIMVVRPMMIKDNGKVVYEAGVNYIANIDFEIIYEGESLMHAMSIYNNASNFIKQKDYK